MNFIDQEPTGIQLHAVDVLPDLDFVLGQDSVHFLNNFSLEQQFGFCFQEW